MKAFREKYGQAWRVKEAVEIESEEKQGKGDVHEGKERQAEEGAADEDTLNLMDMIGSYGQSAATKGQALGVREGKKKSGKGKGGQR